jgi:two-component system nitrate/nitrite response regulator NarL
VFHAGANGYLFVGSTFEYLIKSLELVMLGETILPAAILPLILDQRDTAIAVKAPESLAPQLSPRERLILRYLVKGHANKIIASENRIAESTVKVHVKAILRKIGVGNRTQAAMWAINNGLFAEESGSESVVHAFVQSAIKKANANNEE